MEENLGKLIFDIMVEEYNDKIEKSKNIEDYLKEKNKQELNSLYFLYRHAGDAENIVEDVTHLMKTKKKYNKTDCSIFRFQYSKYITIYE